MGQYAPIRKTLIPVPSCVAAYACEMPCYHPLQAYRARAVNPGGKRGIVFNPRLGYIDLPVTLPCGQCIGCRLERSRQWAIRCVHETQLHENNCFITLTYDVASLPGGGTLVKKHFQNFMKRLRKGNPGRSIRYFHCGEYGEVNARPHYHALIFNHDFSDRELYTIRNDIKLYTSAQLSNLWPHGFSTVGDATFESAAYVARYVLKKITGPSAEEHYKRLIVETGELVSVQPEYITMSLKPAIGKLWYEKFHSDVFPADEVILRGRKLKPPKYYEKLYDISDHDDMEKIKGQRIKERSKHKEDQTPARLSDRKICKLAQIKTLSRSLE